jgi:5'-nucleotidase
MRKLTIIVDLDSTVVDLHPAWLSAYNKKYGDNLKPEDITSWEIHKFAKKGGKGIYNILKEPGFFRGLPPIPGAFTATQKLVHDGHRVVIVGSAPRFSHSDKAWWVDTNMPWIDHENVFFGHNKFLVFADVMIDDGPHNIKAYREQWGFYPLLCAISHPYNQDLHGVADLMAQDWQHPEQAWTQIVDEIRYFANQDLDRKYPRKLDQGPDRFNEQEAA